MNNNDDAPDLNNIELTNQENDKQLNEETAEQI
jgi:hypothetical protein